MIFPRLINALFLRKYRDRVDGHADASVTKEDLLCASQTVHLLRSAKPASFPKIFFSQ
jgi:hypothetical protein